ncbi:hypothetical protein LCGC14_2885290, partial [marine sediment metagenome]
PIVLDYVIDCARMDVKKYGAAAGFYVPGLLKYIRSVDGNAADMGARHVRAATVATVLTDLGTPRAVDGLQKILSGKYGSAARVVGADLLRAKNRIAALIRYLLFKRLESSVAAFRSTLEMLIRSNRNFRQSLDEGFVPIGATATRLLGGESFDPDELVEVLAKEEARRKAVGAKRSKLVHSVDAFDIVRWKEDLDADYEILEEIRRRVAPITPADDDKLQELRAFLAKPDVANGKLIIFSEAETTIEYLFGELNPGNADPKIAMASGSTRDHLQTIIKRFAPKANLKTNERIPGPEIRILLATDIVSEGQNLQDCNRVLNYDLHWNPVRLIQRFGRVDRIGTEHTDIYLHNTWPDLAVDAELDLTDRLLRRIQAFHDFIGLDSKLLSAK